MSERNVVFSLSLILSASLLSLLQVLPLLGPGRAPYSAPQLASLLFGEFLAGLDADEVPASFADRTLNGDEGAHEKSERKKRKSEKKAKKNLGKERHAQGESKHNGEANGEFHDISHSRISSSGERNGLAATAAMDIEDSDATTAAVAAAETQVLKTDAIEELEEDEESPLQRGTTRLRRGAHRWAAAHAIDYSGRSEGHSSSSRFPPASSGHEIDGVDGAGAAAAYGCRNALCLVDALSDVLPPVFDVVGTDDVMGSVSSPSSGATPSDEVSSNGQASGPEPSPRPDAMAPLSDTLQQDEHILPRGFRAPAPRVVFVLARAERLLEPDCAPAASWLLPQLQLVCGRLLEQQQRHLRKTKRKQAISAARRDVKAAVAAAEQAASAVADLARAKDHAKAMAAAAGIAESSNDDNDSVAAQALVNSQASAEAWDKLATRAKAAAEALKKQGVWRSWRLQLALTVAEHPGLMHGGLSRLRDGQLLGRPPVAVLLGAYGRPEPLAGVLRVEVRRLRRTRAPRVTTATTSDTSSGSMTTLASSSSSSSSSSAPAASSSSQDEATRVWLLSEAFAERLEALVVNQLVLATSGVSNLRVLRRAAVELCDALVAQHPELKGAAHNVGGQGGSVGVFDKSSSSVLTSPSSSSAASMPSSTVATASSEEIAAIIRPLLKQLLPRALDEMHNADFSLAVAAPTPRPKSYATRPSNASTRVIAPPVPSQRSSVAKSLTASLPARQRLLLVAAFVASHSPADQDREKFTPAQKGRKRQKGAKYANQTGLAGVMGGNTKSAPAPVDLARLLAIYEVFWGQFGGGDGSKSSNSSPSGRGLDLDLDPEKWVEWQWQGGGGGASNAGSAAVLGHLTSLVRSGLVELVAAPKSSSAIEAKDSSAGSGRKGKNSSSEAKELADGAAAATTLGALDLGRARYRCVVGKFLVEQLATAFGIPLDRYLTSSHA